MDADAKRVTTPEELASRAMIGGRNLPLAIMVGVVLAGLAGAALLWHPLAFTAAVALLVGTGLIETSLVISVSARFQLPVLLVSAAVLIFGAYSWGHAGQMAGVVVLLVGAFVWQVADSDREDPLRRIALTLLFGLWVGFLGSFAVLLVAWSEAGVVGVVAVIGAAILADIGGYAFGVAFGRHKLAPSISPGKTWEGFVGAVVLATAGGIWLLPLLDSDLGWELGAIIGGACAVAAVIGDLAESLIKRDLGVKDLGRLLPGHGGILDRVDGILLALPVGYLLLELLY